MYRSHTPAEFCAGVSHGDRESRLLAEKGDRRWRINNRGLFAYGGGSQAGMPGPLLQPFMDGLARQPRGAVLDVAGGTNGVALQDLMCLGLATKALVTNYEDLRTETTRALPNLGHVDGDLIDPETWGKIGDWKSQHAPEGFAGILCEPIGGLRGLPERFYLGAIHQLIDWTTPNGSLMVNTPDVLATEQAYNDILGRPDVANVYCTVGNTLIIKSQP